MNSLLPKRVLERCRERPDKVVERRPLGRRDHHRCRHPRIKPDVGELGQFRGIEADQRHVIWITVLRVGDSIGGDLNDITVNDRRDALLVGGPLK